MNRIAATLAVAVLAACGSIDLYRREPVQWHRDQGAGSSLGACISLLEAIDRAMDAAEVNDALASRIAGFAVEVLKVHEHGNPGPRQTMANQVLQ